MWFPSCSADTSSSSVTYCLLTDCLGRSPGLMETFQRSKNFESRRWKVNRKKVWRDSIKKFEQKLCQKTVKAPNWVFVVKLSFSISCFSMKKFMWKKVFTKIRRRIENEFGIVCSRTSKKWWEILLLRTFQKKMKLRIFQFKKTTWFTYKFF